MKVDFSETRLYNADLRDIFYNAKPFPFVVIDNFLPERAALGVLNEILSFPISNKSNDYIFAKNKFEDHNLEKIGPWGSAIRNMLLSQEMANALSSIYGRPVFVDPEFVGGGLHRGGAGSFLDMHADFEAHPIQKKWLRELNILLYLNEGWSPEYGGSLDLVNAKTGDNASIEPKFNRLVIMLTKDFTLHGYRSINFPKGLYRTSVAAYAYSELDFSGEGDNYRTTTRWAPESAGVGKSLMARLAPFFVRYKQRIFGSATAKRK